jgi:single-strand DNA-binding protein
MNLVILSGYLGQDVESKSISQDLTISNLSLATSRFVKGEKTTDWHNIKLFNHEKLLPYLKKGSNILINGFTSTESWEKDGQKFYKTIVTVEKIELLSTPNSDQNSEPH